MLLNNFKLSAKDIYISYPPNPGIAIVEEPYTKGNTCSNLNLKVQKGGHTNRVVSFSF